MKSKIAVLTLVTTLFLGASIASASPKIIAAKIHSDHCGSCKIMGPAVKEASKSLQNSDVLFVKFDLTDEGTTHQSALLASALGIEEVFDANQKTGKVLLIDAKTKEVRGKLNKMHTSDQMVSAVNTVLAGGMVKDEMKGSAEENMKGSGSHGMKGSH